MQRIVKIIMAALGIVLLPGCSSETGVTEKKATDTVYTHNENSDSLCQPDWFPHNKTPEPKEGANSLFAEKTTTNAIFHQWSWQKFLWLTKPLPGGTPLFEDETTLVDNNMIPVPPHDGISLVLTDYTQADGGVLMTNPDYSPENISYTVFYSIYTNDTLQEFSEEYAKKIIANPDLVNNLDTFPVGSLELKASWVNTKAIPKDQLNQFYTRDAVIAPDGKDPETVNVAMLGMHVVGVVENHPEFIWATFEHQSIVPKYQWSYPDEGSNYLHPVSSNTSSHALL